MWRVVCSSARASCRCAEAARATRTRRDRTAYTTCAARRGDSSQRGTRVKLAGATRRGLQLDVGGVSRGGGAVPVGLHEVAVRLLGFHTPGGVRTLAEYLHTETQATTSSAQKSGFTVQRARGFSSALCARIGRTMLAVALDGGARGAPQRGGAHPPLEKSRGSSLVRLLVQTIP